MQSRCKNRMNTVARYFLVSVFCGVALGCHSEIVATTVTQLKQCKQHVGVFADNGVSYDAGNGFVVQEIAHYGADDHIKYGGQSTDHLVVLSDCQTGSQSLIISDKGSSQDFLEYLFNNSNDDIETAFLNYRRSLSEYRTANMSNGAMDLGTDCGCKLHYPELAKEWVQ